MGLTNSDVYPEKTLTEAENYCRDNGNKGAAWCYAINSHNDHKFCDIPLCPLTEPARHWTENIDCIRNSGYLYKGTLNTTKTGKTCQR